MSTTRWVISAFLVWHLAALGLAAVPSPDRLPSVGPARHPTDDVVAAQLTPFFDSAAGTVAYLCQAAWKVIGRVRRPAAIYVDAIGLEERWNMFANPPRIDQYLRVRYYVATKTVARQPVPSWVATELVFPTHREDHIRIVRSYWDKHKDKAMSVALDGFYRRRNPQLIRPGTHPDDLPDDVAPIGRYFARRFERDHLIDDERILRTEVWRGRAENPSRGAVADARVQERRLATLRRYYDGPIEQTLPSFVSYPPYHAGEREADIEWVLEYFEER
jgi:hypothetical protein